MYSLYTFNSNNDGFLQIVGQTMFITYYAN